MLTSRTFVVLVLSMAAAVSVTAQKRGAISGAITPQTVARELARGGATSSARRTALLESLAQALTTFTTAGYSRDGKLDDTVLDEALTTAFQVNGT